MNRRTRFAWIGTGTITALAVVAMLLQACKDQSLQKAPAPATSPALRTIRFSDGGYVTIERKGEFDEVNVEDGKGQSWCPVALASYDATAALFRRLQQAVAAGDQPAVAALMRYPLRVNGKSRVEIDSSAELLRRYPTVLTADLTRQILAANPQVVFCRGDGNMFADGAVWANNDNGRIAVYAINR